MKAGAGLKTRADGIGKGSRMRRTEPKFWPLIRPGLWVILALAAPAAWAAPLEPEECKTLSSEYDSLVEAGAKSDMAKGVEWAKANLAPERLSRIARLITVEEKLSFRCGQIVTATPMMRDTPNEKSTPTSTKRLSRIPIPVKKSTATAGTASKKK